MPYPENLQLSQRVTAILRAKGVEPATVAVRNGHCHVGLSVEELQDLAMAGKEGRARKCSTRELSLILAQHERQAPGDSAQWGATTVASTMYLAYAAGIHVFVTGGIGGVHRGGEQSMDVSADLIELSRTPTIVVSAGIKSILDIPRTLEVLETYGVPTLAYQTDDFPAFFSPTSGVQTPARADSPEEIAAAFLAAEDIGLRHGMLVAVPNSDPAGEAVEAAIQSALEEASAKGIHGQAVTPFVLKRVAEATGGESLRSNMALVEHNATVGADIALALAELRQSREHVVSVPWKPPWPRSKVVVLGGSVLDVVARPEPGLDLILGTSNPSICTESDGGVGRNIAEVLGLLGVRPILFSAVGNDSRGAAMIQRLETECGVQAQDTIDAIEGANTATYVAVLDGSGDLHTACADMAVLQRICAPPPQVLMAAEALIMDANPPIDVLRSSAMLARDAGLKVYMDPTSVPKAHAVSNDDELLSCLTCIFPNKDELAALVDVSLDDDDDDMGELQRMCTSLLRRMSPSEAQLVVTLGAKGVLLASRSSIDEDPAFELFITQPRVPVNATGAGDSLCGAFVYGILNGLTLRDAVHLGMDAASLSIACESTISTALSKLR